MKLTQSPGRLLLLASAGDTPKLGTPQHFLIAHTPDQGHRMSLQLPTGTPSSARRASRKNNRRRARSASVFTAASAGSTRADDELATAKAAAIRLLDHSSPPLLKESTTPPAPKRIRFEDPPAILVGEASPAEPIIHAITPQEPPINPSCEPTGAPKHPDTHHSCRPRTPPNTLPISPNNRSRQKDTFQVSREEIFAETALVDAFQAAMDEFVFHCFGKNPASASIRLPQSHAEERRIAALYYGKPPPRSSTKSKKPPLQTIFLPPLPAATTEPSTLDGEDTQKKVGLPTRQASPVVSDLDMDDYWDMVAEGSE